MSEKAEKTGIETVRFTFGVFGSARDVRSLAIPGGMLLLAVALIVLGGMQAYFSFNKVKVYEIVTGTVVRIEGEGSETKAVVQFYTKEGFSETADLMGLYPVGKTVKVYYNPNDVSDVLFWSYSSLLIYPFLIVALGLLICFLGGAIFWSNLQRKRIFDWLVEDGVKVSARVLKVLKPENTMTAKVRSGHGLHSAQNSLGFKFFSGKSRVVATWYDRVSDSTHEFCSEPFISSAGNIGDATIDVYYARGKMEVYYVDLGSVRRAER
jgi:hypothetical protein